MAGLHFGAGIDTKQWSKDVERMRRDILSITKEGEKVDLLGIKKQIEVQKEAISELEKEYKAVGDQMSKLAPGSAHARLLAEHKKLGVALEEEKQHLKVLNDTYKSFADEQQQAIVRQRKLRYELYELADAGKENTEEFRQLAKELAELDESIGVVQGMQSALRRGKPAMEALTGSVRVGVGVFTTITGLMGAFSQQSERLAEIQTRLQSVMAISIGIEQTYSALRKQSGLISSIRILQMRAEAKAQDLATKGTIRATVAQRAFNLVAKANPYVLLATALLSVVGAIALFTKGNKKAREEHEKMTKSINDSISGDIVKFKLLQAEWQRASGNVVKQKQVVKDFNKEFGSTAGKLENIIDAEKLFSENTKAFVDAMQRRAEAEYLVAEATTVWAKLRHEEQKVRDFEEDWANSNVWGKISMSAKIMWKDIFGGDVVDERKVKELQDQHNELIDEILDKQIEAQKAFAKLGLTPPEDVDKEKKVTKTLQQQLDERRKLYEDYYKAIELLGTQKADEIYFDTLGENKTYLAYLENLKSEYLEIDKLTKEQAENLILIDDIIADLTGRETTFDKELREITAISEQYEVLADKLEYLRMTQADLGDTPDDLRLRAEIQKLIESAQAERKAIYDEIHNANLEFEEIVRRINVERENALSVAVTDRAREYVNTEADKKTLEAYINHLKEIYPEMDKVFSDIQSLTRQELRKFREIFVKELELTEDTAKKAEIAKVIDRIDFELRKLDVNPLRQLSISFKELLASKDDLDKFIEELGKFNDALFEITGTFKGMTSDIRSFSDDLAISLDNDFGDILDSIDQTLEGFEMMAEGVEMIAIGVASGNPVAIIGGTIKSIAGLTKAVSAWFNSDKKKERQIQRILGQIKELEGAYRDLEHGINQALGTEVFDMHLKQIENLKKQQEKLYEAIAKEERKKKKNRDRIKEWEEEIKEIDRVIDNITDTIKDKLMGTDVRQFADNLADALVGAFLAGENAANSLNQTVDDLFANIIRNFIGMRLAENLAPIFDELADALMNTINDPEPVWDVIGGQSFEDYMAELSAWRLRQLGVGDMGVSDEDVDRFRDEVEGEVAKNKQLIERLMEIFGISTDAELKGLQGALQGMSEETAGVLVGQFNAIRMDTSNLVLIAQRNEGVFSESLIYLSGIKNDTSNLSYIRSELVELNRKIEGNDNRSIGL